MNILLCEDGDILVINQAYLFLIFVINGFLIGLLFDFFRVLRKSFKTLDIITHIEDIIFWILTGALILYFIFVFNNGEIRAFMFWGIAIGVVLYVLLLSKHIIKINTYIINIAKKTIKYFIDIILKKLKKYDKKCIKKEGF